MRPLIILILLSTSALADYTIANTANWQDIYSAGIDAAIAGNEFTFLISPKHSETLIEQIPKNTRITIYETERVPFIRNYQERLSNEGYTVRSTTVPEDTLNLYLAEKGNYTHFIIIDPTFGYDAISIAPYAVATKSYVLFATEDNIQDISAFLTGHNAAHITLFGNLAESVTETLADFRPEVINEGTHYDNNLAIARKLETLAPPDQALLTNGEFLEHDIFTAGLHHHPIIFIGKNSPPEETLNYLRASPYKTFVVLGNDLITSAQTVKTTVGRPLFIKFGKGVTGDTTFKEVQGLDIYRTPIIDLLLKFQGLTYNTDTQTVELVVENAKNARTFLRPSILIRSDQTPLITLGEEETSLLDRQETRGFAYPADLLDNLDTNLTAQIFIPYGAYEKTLEFALNGELPLTIVTQQDRCTLTIEDATYDAETQRVLIRVETDKNCFARPSLQNIIVNGKERTITGQTQNANGKTTLEVKQALDQVDLADNREITVKIAFGTREQILAQFIQATIPLRTPTDTWPAIITIAAVIIILIALLWRKTSKKR